MVHISEGHEMKFKCISTGLYLFDASNVDLSKLRNVFSFLNTVLYNIKMFRNRDAQKANDAVKLNHRTNHMAHDKFVRVVGNNWIRNNPVIVGDINRLKYMYGPPLPQIKGRA